MQCIPLGRGLRRSAPRCGRACLLDSSFRRVVKPCIAILRANFVLITATTVIESPLLFLALFHGRIGGVSLCMWIDRSRRFRSLLFISTSTAYTAGGYICVRAILGPRPTRKDQNSAQIVVAAIIALVAATPQLGRGSEQRCHPIGSRCGRRGRCHRRCRCPHLVYRCTTRAAAGVAAWGRHTVVVKAADMAQLHSTATITASVGRTSGCCWDR